MSLNENDIKKALNNLSFPKNSFWLIMGSALVFHGIRDCTQDIDIGCCNQLFEELKSKGYTVYKSRSGKEKINYSDSIHIYRNWETTNVIFIDGIPVADLKSILKDKKKLGRPKDIIDISIIEKHLKG